MKRSIAQLLCALIFLSVVSGSVWAESIEFDPAQIDLITSFDVKLYERDFGEPIPIPMPTPNDIVQGPYRINLKGIGEKKELEINFQAANPEVYALMADQLAIQYCILSEGNEGQWSEWSVLSQLPLKIRFRDQNSQSLVNPQESNRSPKEVVVLIRIKVPQSLMPRQGVYQGEFLLKVS